MMILTDKRDEWKKALVNELTDFVRQYGDECGAYDLENFGLDVEDDQVTMVLDILDNGGCYFTEQTAVNMPDKTEWGFMYHAFQCLYMVRQEDGTEVLKFYEFWNNGIEWDGEAAEPDHDFAESLELHTLCRVYEAVRDAWGEK